MRAFVNLGMAVVFFFSIAGCTSLLGTPISTSDLIVARLAVGMPMDEVNAAFSQDKYIDKSEQTLAFLGEVASSSYEVYPPNLLRQIAPGSKYWLYTYWVTANNRHGVSIFISPDGRIIGWIKQHSHASIAKYSHERLTAGLKKGMTKKQVASLLGAPQEIADRAFRRSDYVNIYEDHYWSDKPLAGDITRETWIYSYPLDDGSQRHVYVLWNRVGVDCWGYDQANQEAERHLRMNKRSP